VERKHPHHGNTLGAVKMNGSDWVPEDGFAAYQGGDYATALRL
jgi:hypothetical protein